MAEVKEHSTDKELLELAAKAAGIQCLMIADIYDEPRPCYIDEHGFPILWNPLEDDGDALRLAVKLDLDISHMVSGVKVAECLGIDEQGDSFMVYEEYRYHKRDKLAATRRAIVRCAAEIGRLT